MKKPELLAPAGDLERLKWAIDYGADAVYLGGPSLGLRANAKNFTYEDIEQGCIYAHERGKKIYVTVNIVLHNQEAEELDQTLEILRNYDIDALIASDPTVVDKALKMGFVVHLSTQQSTLNKEACKYWYEQGVSRIVLARETPLEDIIEIHKYVPDLEIECFLHGAMCASMSGRCVLSNFFTNRDANRGGCAQICRWDFDLYDENNQKIEGEYPFTFCSKDLSLLKMVPDMIKAGITTFKIEGRMRSIYYIATIVHTYRQAIDEYWNHPTTYTYNKAYEKILRNCANRDSIVQFIDGSNHAEMGYYNGREEVSNQDFLGVVLAYNFETKQATIEERNYFSIGDEVEIFGPHKDILSFIIEEIKDEQGRPIDVVRHPKQVVFVTVPFPVEAKDLMRKKTI